MNGTSGFQEVLLLPSRSSTNRLLHEQRSQRGMGSYHLLGTHNLTALSIGISEKHAEVHGRGKFGERRTTLQAGTIGLFRQTGQKLALALIVSVLLTSATSVAEASDGRLGSILMSNSSICLSEILERISSYVPKEPPGPGPGPDPPPFLIGCEGPSCDSGASGPIDLQIDLQGDVVEWAILEIDGLLANTELQFTGAVEKSAAHTNQFFIGKSAEQTLSGKRVSRINGLPSVRMDHPISTEKLIDALLDPQSAPFPPIASIRFSFDKAALEKLDVEARKTNAPSSKTLSTVDLAITQTRGKTAMDRHRIHLNVNWCRAPKIPTDVVRSVDQIHLVESQPNGVEDFPENAIVLANGRVPGGNTSRWLSTQAFKSMINFNMPQNMLQDDMSCEQTAYDHTQESCAPEISVFSQGRGVKLVTPVQDWTPDLGDKAKVEVTAANSMLTVPIHFYIAWQHPQGTNSLAQTWLDEANTVFGLEWSGIQFDAPIVVERIASASSPLLRAGCIDRGAIYQHFGIDPALLPDAVRVFFVQLSTEADNNGRPIYANGWACDTAPDGATSNHTNTHLYNDIFISTAIANSTTLAHELGHALSLQDLNQAADDPSYPEEWAKSLERCLNPAYSEPACNYLMWSGSPARRHITKGQSFRANVNQTSAVHRHNILGNALGSLPPRICMDHMSTITCPALTLDKD